MTIPKIGPSGGAGNSGADDTFTPKQSVALNAFGWFLVFIALVPPITVILWRLATMPWGQQ
jgi:hypothetical protein